MSRALLVRDVESRDLLRTEVGEKESDELSRSLFLVLRKGEVREGEREEVERSEDEVEVRLEGCREGQEEGCVAKFKSGAQGGGISMEVRAKNLFSRLGAA